MAKRRRNWLKHHRVGGRLVVGVMLLQGAMLLTLFVTRPWVLPPKVRLFELMWASMREPVFYPLAALVFGGPALTILALCIRGSHRLWLLVSWIVFLVVIHLFYYNRMLSMLRSFYWAMTY